MAASNDAYDAKRYTRQLYEIASTFEVDSSVPIKRYYRSGAEMERQVRGLVGPVNARAMLVFLAGKGV